MPLNILILLIVSTGFSLAAADPWAPPAVAKDFRGTVTGTVKWVHDSTWWCMLDVASVEPKNGDAERYAPLTTLDTGLKIGLKWVSPKRPDPDQHAWIKGLTPGQQVRLELEPSGRGTNLRLVRVLDAKGKAGGGAKPKDGSKYGPGTLVPPEERGARIDEATIVHSLRVDPSDPDAIPTIAEAWPRVRAHLAAGEPTKLVLAAGVHRGSWGVIDVTPTIRDTLLVIEGAGREETHWAGSEVYPAERWRDHGDGLYSAPWTKDWGNHCYVWEAPKVPGHRSEMVFVDGELMTQVVIERYDYRRGGQLMDHGNRKHGWTYTGFADPTEDPELLPRGSFGVAEMTENGDRIFVRLPEGKTIDGSQVEVSEHRNPFSFLDETPFRPGKHQLVMRGLTIRHFASRTLDWGKEGTIALGGNARDLLFEGCAFVWNNSTGLRLKAQRVTVRDCESSYNGHSGFGGEFGTAVLERNVTNYNQWRGAWGGMHGWNWGGVKFGGAHGGNQTIRGHESIGNLSHGFWYDIHPHHIDIDDLVSCHNWHTGLDLELAQGPYTIRRMLAAGNRSAQFTMSIVGEFELRDCILYGGPSKTTKLKQQQVPTPVVNMQWYTRTDEHALHRPMVPTRFAITDCVLVASSEIGGMFVEHNGIHRDQPNYAKVDQAYRGSGNLLHSAGAPMAFTFVQHNWQPKTTDLAGWQAHTREDDPILTDPGFADPASYDFTLSADSPLAGRDDALPTLRVDPAKIAEAQRYFIWIERGKLWNGASLDERLKNEGITEVE